MATRKLTNLDLLIAAADHLDQAINHPDAEYPVLTATAGPWTTWSDLDSKWCTDVLTVAHAETAGGHDRGQLVVCVHAGVDAPYIAAMNPIVGAALVSLLRFHALVPTSASSALIALARAVLDAANKKAGDRS